MKQKIHLKSFIALLLCVVILFCGTMSVLALVDNAVDYSEFTKTENLFKNGNFAELKNNKPLGWTIFNESKSGNYDISTNQKTPEGDRALTLTSNNDYSTNVHGGRYIVWNDSAFIVEQNTTYTISFYIKSTIKGLTFYLYEPQFEDKNGIRTSNQPQEGINTYTYDYDNGQTRVIRTDIQHTKTLSNGYTLPGNNSIVRISDVISPDYPKQEKVGEWVKYTHTFTTGSLPEHEGIVRYGIQIPGSEKGKSVSFGSFVATATKKTVANTYTPKVNNGSYGWVDPVEVTDGENVIMVASVAEGHEFLGWYKNGNYVSNNPILSFIWDDNIVDPGYEARFDKGSNSNLIKSEGFESYSDNQSLKTRYGRNQNNWQLAAQNGVSFEFVRASSIRAHGGKMSARVNAGGSYIGYNITGLAPNTEYAFSAYAWIPATSFAKSFSLEDVLVLPKGKALFENKEFAVSEKDILAREQNVLKGNDAWQRFAVKFKTESSGDVTVWMKSSKYCYMYLDDMAVFSPVTVSVNSLQGGTAMVNPTGTVVKGSAVSFVAEPNIGNVFVAWKENGNIVSTDKEYKITAENDINLTAEFDGFNSSTDDLFVARGWDGTFEKDTIPGWYASHKNPSEAAIVNHCTYSRSTKHAHSGKYSLRVCSYHRATILPLTDLKQNTDYRLSFYYYYEDFAEQVLGATGVLQNAIIDKDNVDITTAETIYDKITTNLTMPNTGWYKVDFYFNTGDQTAVNYLMYYGSSDTSNGCVYFDDMTLSEYYPNENIKNSQFNNIADINNTKVFEDWCTNGTPVLSSSNNTLTLDKNEIAYQIFKTDLDALYTVTFKAKGKVRGAAVDLARSSTNIIDLLSSVSYVDTASNSLKEYSFKFYSGSQKAVKVMFEGLLDGCEIDDITIQKSELSDGGIVEKIDFESDRFKFASDTVSNFSVYKKKNNSDSNVLSGEHSLMLTPGGDDEMNRFSEAFMGFRLVVGVSYTVEFNYKSDTAGTIYLSPDIEERFAVEQNFNKTLSNKWQKAKFSFTATNNFVIKAIIASIAKSAKGTVYFDDIVIKACLPFIDGYNLEKTYCDNLYNLVDHQSFEGFSEDSSWGILNKGFSVAKDNNAATETHVMRVKAGAKQTFVYDASPGKIYELGVSLRGNSNTKGKVYITIDSAGKYFYNDTSNVARSIITSSDDGKWKRDAFSFPAATSGKIYVTIECTAGVMDIDNFMLFESKFATLADNNTYRMPTPYDYDNPNYVKMVSDESDFWGSLGDMLNIKNAIILAFISLTFVIGSLISKKRKGKYCGK